MRLRAAHIGRRCRKRARPWAGLLGRESGPSRTLVVGHLFGRACPRALVVAYLSFVGVIARHRWCPACARPGSVRRAWWLHVVRAIREPEEVIYHLAAAIGARQEATYHLDAANGVRHLAAALERAKRPPTTSARHVAYAKRWSTTSGGGRFVALDSHSGVCRRWRRGQRAHGRAPDVCQGW